MDADDTIPEKISERYVSIEANGGVYVWRDRELDEAYAEQRRCGGVIIDLSKVGRDAFVAPPSKRKMWVNCYENGNGSASGSRYKADSLARPGRIACVEVEFEEGQGL